MPLSEKRLHEYRNPDNDPRGPWESKPWKAGTGQSGTRYRIVSPTGKIFDEEWLGSEQTYKQLLAQGIIYFPKGGDGLPRKKYYLSERQTEGQPAHNFWVHKEYGSNQEASSELENLFGEANVYSNPKPSRLITAISKMTTSKSNAMLDFFAGSGTTGHAVINLNREDGGRRKFILVEMANYFDTVLLPRIQKVMYAPDWKHGRPKRLPTKEEVERTPRLVKVLCLKGYEDALHNLTTEETLKREEPRATAHKERLGPDAYRVCYLVRLPLEASASMLNLSALEHPFDYTIEILTEDGPRVETVDLIETFNFLYGLHVERLETWVNEGDKRTYRVVKGRNRDGKRVLVLWRGIEGLEPVVERAFLEAKLKTEGPFDEMLINGDTATPGFRSLDGLFKRLLEEDER